ncbi:11023_t:CDS:1 [Entrophospora sp. SA101]|nr:11023_t:CDS:1 [Entrophospora sp. SA101]
MLINCLIHFSELGILLRKDNVQLNFELLENPPLHNYAIFVKRLAIFKGHFQDLVLVNENTNLLIENLVPLILKNSNIEEIYLSDLTIPYLPNDFHNNEGLYFENIKILHYDNAYSPKLLKKLVGTVNKIEKLSVEIKKPDEAGDGLGELINQQSKLRIMQLLVEKDCSLFAKTLEALSGKSGSLIEFRGYIHTMNEMLEKGAEFKNMKRLDLFNHYDDENNSMGYFKHAEFPSLEEFHFQFNAKGDMDDLIQFIIRNGSNLKVIVIEGNPDEILLKLFIKETKKTCRNLKSLSTPISS